MLSPVRAVLLDRSLDQPIPYLGGELRPHWILEQTGVYGSAVAAFIGPCSVATGALVDMEDRLANDRIESRSMLHLIAELYGTNLEAGVFAQRLLMTWAERLLGERGIAVKRSGDDLFFGDGTDRRKLSVSIATVSPVSVLIHWGFNLDATGAPVRAVGLAEFGWSEAMAFSFAKDLLDHYIGELEEIRIAQCKVRPV